MVIRTTEVAEYFCPKSQQHCKGERCMAWSRLPPLVVNNSGKLEGMNAFTKPEQERVHRGRCGAFDSSPYDFEYFHLENQKAPCAETLPGGEPA